MSALTCVHLIKELYCVGTFTGYRCISFPFPFCAQIHFSMFSDVCFLDTNEVDVTPSVWIK